MCQRDKKKKKENKQTVTWNFSPERMYIQGKIQRRVHFRPSCKKVYLHLCSKRVSTNLMRQLRWPMVSEKEIYKENTRRGKVQDSTSKVRSMVLVKVSPPLLFSSLLLFDRGNANRSLGSSPSASLPNMAGNILATRCKQLTLRISKLVTYSMLAYRRIVI